MNNIAIIPARGGSRRIPKKNIKPFEGQPIIAYSIAAAARSNLFGAIYVSTDSAEVARVAECYGAFVHRRAKILAEDNVGTQEVTRNVLLELKEWQRLDPAFTCCIYPCAPMLRHSDLQLARRQLDEGYEYAICDALFYFGRTEAFLNDVSLEDGVAKIAFIDVGRRGIDINVQADWDEAELMFRTMEEA